MASINRADFKLLEDGRDLVASEHWLQGVRRQCPVMRASSLQWNLPLLKSQPCQISRLSSLIHVGVALPVWKETRESGGGIRDVTWS
ncbi:hypothetical protein EYF80_035736 [Liparis tanakae]|uniref:Uncharacterized protein n=1 Tax=Liparis tanakae TaxID=230148 RepID=A0A4Z2GLA7_9TELE|nr:hypothetical protein EYF80_035736 [Liparis tanakae]